MRVTANKLRKMGACKEDGIDVFAAEWPDGCNLTKKALLRAVEIGLDVDWFAREVLTGVALTEYDKRVALLWAEYDKRVAPLRAEYDKRVAPLRAEFNKKVAPLWAEYDKQMALLFWQLVKP